MVPYTATITSSLVNTFFMAAAVYWYAVITVVKEKGLHHLFDLFFPSGCPYILGLLLIPIEFISYVFRVVSLSVRLFANMMAGHTLMKVIVGFSWSMILAHYFPFIILFILTVLEIAVAMIQSYIFTILTYMYLSDVFVGH
jgi:F-type H+-transporting ATPase subunit a